MAEVGAAGDLFQNGEWMGRLEAADETRPDGPTVLWRDGRRTAFGFSGMALATPF